MVSNVQDQNNLLSRRLAEVSAKHYIDLNGNNTPYIQTGHQAKIDAATKTGDTKAILSTLTTTEVRASVVARVKRLTAEQRENVTLPEAGSAEERSQLDSLNARLESTLSRNALQQHQTESVAAVRGAQPVVEVTH